jgi:hypothetical protein
MQSMQSMEAGGGRPWAATRVGRLRACDLPAEFQHIAGIELPPGVEQVAMSGAGEEDQPAVRGDLLVQRAGFVGAGQAVAAAGED